MESNICKLGKDKLKLHCCDNGGMWSCKLRNVGCGDNSSCQLEKCQNRTEEKSHLSGTKGETKNLVENVFRISSNEM